MIEPVFESILIASRDASIIALMVFVLLKIAGERVTPGWRHLLWLLVALRLVTPTFSASPISWQRLLPLNQLSEFVTEPSTATSKLSGVGTTASISTLDDIGASHSDDKNSAPQAESSWDWSLFFCGAWLIGTSILLATMVIRTIRFRRQIVQQSLSNSEADNLQDLVNVLTKSFGYTNSPLIRLTQAVNSPAITGLRKPELLIPPGLVDELSDDEWRMILLHELGHWRRFDLHKNWLLSVLQAVHWFNPLVWYSFRRARVEAESACDTWVLQKIGKEKSPVYGELLIRLLELATPKSLVPRVVGVVENYRDLHQRITSISRYSKQSRRTALTGLLLVGGIGMIGFTKAPEKEEKEKVISVQIKVIDHEGNPEAGAELWISDGYYDFRTAKTDENGIYVAAMSVDREFFRFPGFIHGNIGAKSDSGKLGFESLRGTQTSITLKTIHDTGSLKFRVVDKEKQPIPNLSFQPRSICTPGFSHWNLPGLFDELWTAKTNSDGICEMHGLPTDLPILVKHSDPRFSRTDHIGPIYFSGLKAGNISKISELVLHPAGKVSGIVRLPNGNPTPNVVFRLESRGSEVQEHRETDQTGSFEFEQLIKSSYTMEMDYLNSKADEWLAPIQFDLASGEHKTDLDITLLKPGAVLIGKIILEGLEHDFEEKPLYLMIESEVGGRRGRGFDVALDGSFEIRVLAGNNKIEVSSPFFPIEPIEPVSLNFEKGETKTHNFVIKRKR